MQNRNTRMEFMVLLAVVLSAVLLLTNGFSARISAQDNEPDVYKSIEPIGVVLDTILREYVKDPEMEKVVEGALMGMMSSLDRHSSYIPAPELTSIREETKGEFEGIGVSIKQDEQERIIVFTPIPGSPAATAGLLPFDIIIAIDDVPTEGMNLGDAADKIRGPRGTSVKLTVARTGEGQEEPEILDFNVKRAKVPLESLKEARLLDGGIAYVRVSDFKDTTARDIKKRIEEFMEQGMTAFILDLRWNPGGLLTASKEVSELFLPQNSLVTYTKGRARPDGAPNREDMELYTQARPVMPPDMPVLILVNGQTASSSEIVTGALQFHQRAIVIGEKTFGKGSVQTIIPLRMPEMTALRLTTALYYTPADVTIDQEGIKPDVEVVMTREQEQALGVQMYKSFETDPTRMHLQNHGSATGDAAIGDEPLAEDLPLLKALEMLREGLAWDALLQRYHRDVSETQVAKQAESAAAEAGDAPAEAPETPGADAAL
jgi:carboxyl-terminal processing protease